LFGRGFVGACGVVAAIGLLTLQTSVLRTGALKIYVLAAPGTRFFFLGRFLEAEAFRNGFLTGAFLNRNPRTAVTPAIPLTVSQHGTVIVVQAAL